MSTTPGSTDWAILAVAGLGAGAGVVVGRVGDVVNPPEEGVPKEGSSPKPLRGKFEWAMTGLTGATAAGFMTTWPRTNPRPPTASTSARAAGIETGFRFRRRGP